jgi:sterol desaturase/sphingolipid hydroxylase (fatty acid hydroxylase superfamily)
MPLRYYSFEGGISPPAVARCLLCQDLLQYAMHRVEHHLPLTAYRASHKPHHRFTNPKLFDAFDGSVADTVLMVLLPLAATAQLNPEVRGACGAAAVNGSGSLLRVRGRQSAGGVGR